MAITKVQSKTVYPGNQAIFDSDNTNGNLLIAFAVYAEAALEGSISDTNGNVWINIDTASYSGSGSPVRVDIAYAFNCKPGPNTVNYTPGLSDIGMSIFEYSGIGRSGSPSPPVTDTNTSGIGTTSPTGDAVSGIKKDVLALAIFGSESQAQTSITADAPFTVRESSPSHAHAIADYVTLSNGETLQPSFNLNNSDDNWIIRMILFDALAPRFARIGGKLLVMNNKIITGTN